MPFFPLNKKYISAKNATVVDQQVFYGTRHVSIFCRQLFHEHQTYVGFFIVDMNIAVILASVSPLIFVWCKTEFSTFWEIKCVYYFSPFGQIVFVYNCDLNEDHSTFYK